MQNISTEKVCFIIARARQQSAKEGEVIPDWGSNSAEDDMRVVLEDNQMDASREELLGAIHSLAEDERIELLALTLMGRGDVEDWREALRTARDNPDKRTPRHLAGMPLLGDYLEAGLDQLGFSCT
jgi:hypothetical protein